MKAFITLISSVLLIGVAGASPVEYSVASPTLTIGLTADGEITGLVG